MGQLMYIALVLALHAQELEATQLWSIFENARHTMVAWITPSKLLVAQVVLETANSHGDLECIWIHRHTAIPEKESCQSQNISLLDTSIKRIQIILAGKIRLRSPLSLPIATFCNSMVLTIRTASSTTTTLQTQGSPWLPIFAKQDHLGIDSVAGGLSRAHRSTHRWPPPS